jgi:hypothetical protein
MNNLLFAINNIHIFTAAVVAFKAFKNGTKSAHYSIHFLFEAV